jgi:hypothetical protein
MTASSPTFPTVAEHRDGQRDFDFVVGRWSVELRRLRKPLSGSDEWDVYTGWSEGRPLWDGRANIDEFRVYCAATDTHLDGVTLRLYNPETREWSLYWANGANGVLAMPPTVGRFTDAGGEFFDEEEYAGQPIIVRYQWSDLSSASAQFEQAWDERSDPFTTSVRVIVSRVRAKLGEPSLIETVVTRGYRMTEPTPGG